MKLIKLPNFPPFGVLCYSIKTQFMSLRNIILKPLHYEIFSPRTEINRTIDSCNSPLQCSENLQCESGKTAISHCYGIYKLL